VRLLPILTLLFSSLFATGAGVPAAVQVHVSSAW
jgi:hypothetical protein